MITNYEAAALGLVLLESDVAAEVCGTLEPAMLTTPRLPTVLEAMRALHAERTPVDVISVTDQLRRAEAIPPEEGWPKFLSDLMHNGAVRSNLSAYLAEVRRAHLGRRIIETAKRIAEDPEAAERIEDLQRLAVARSLEDGERAFCLADDIGRYTETLLDGKQAEQTYETGLPALDAILGGLKPGMLMSIGGRPGGHKTTLSLRIALNLAERGLRVLIFNSEMRVYELMNRIMPALAGVEAWRLHRGKITDTDKRKILDAGAAAHGKLNVWLMDKPSPSLADVRAWIAKVKPHVVVLDHLQQFSKPKAENTTRQFDAFMYGLKQLLLETKTVGILACQINRVTDRAEGPPKLSDFRDAGSVEATSDICLLLHSKPPATPGDSGDLIGLVEKNRYGPRGAVLFDVDPEYVNIRGARPSDGSEPRLVSSGRKKQPSHGLGRKDAMAGDAYQPEAPELEEMPF